MEIAVDVCVLIPKDIIDVLASGSNTIGLSLIQFEHAHAVICQRGIFDDGLHFSSERSGCAHHSICNTNVCPSHQLASIDQHVAQHCIEYFIEYITNISFQVLL